MPPTSPKSSFIVYTSLSVIYFNDSWNILSYNSKLGFSECMYTYFDVLTPKYLYIWAPNKPKPVMSSFISSSCFSSSNWCWFASRSRNLRSPTVLRYRYSSRFTASHTLLNIWGNVAFEIDEKLLTYYSFNLILRSHINILSL